MNRRLYRCRHDRRLAGVAGGLAEFFDLDPTLVRLLWVASILFGGIGILVYLGLAIIVPLEPIVADGDAGAAGGEPVGTSPIHRHAPRRDGRWTTFAGLALILFGTLALVDRLIPALDIRPYVVPAGMIGIGVLLVASAVRREPMGS